MNKKNKLKAIFSKYWILLLPSIGLLMILLYRLLRKYMTKPVNSEVKQQNYNEIEIINIARSVFPDIDQALQAVAVAAFESGNFKSSLYKKTNNAFNMGLMANPSNRIDKYKFGKTNEPAYLSVYSDLQSSFKDFKLWLSRKKVEMYEYDTDSLVNQMKSRGYFVSDAAPYRAGVKKYYEKYKQIFLNQ